MYRGQISIDYDREFPSVEVGPRLVRSFSQVSVGWRTQVMLLMLSFPFEINVLFLQNADNEEFWEKLTRRLDPSSPQKEPVNPSSILPQLKSKLLALEAQVRRHLPRGRTSTQPLNQWSHIDFFSPAGRWKRWRSVSPPTAEVPAQLDSDLWPWTDLRHWSETWSAPRPLWSGPGFCRKPEFHQGGCCRDGTKLNEASVLLTLVLIGFCSSLPVQQAQGVAALGEMLITLRLYWEKQHDWTKQEQRSGYWLLGWLLQLYCFGNDTWRKNKLKKKYDEKNWTTQESPNKQTRSCDFRTNSIYIIFFKNY